MIGKVFPPGFAGSLRGQAKIVNSASCSKVINASREQNKLVAGHRTWVRTRKKPKHET